MRVGTVIRAPWGVPCVVGGPVTTVRPARGVAELPKVLATAGLSRRDALGRDVLVGVA